MQDFGQQAGCRQTAMANFNSSESKKQLKKKLSHLAFIVRFH